ncbi:MAG: Asp-tRNA(Asn)/Glu-tRNA(Gln) amidotransferase subunit GatC [Armatimonadota bacterium]|nr:Asp-tRNA(Asn)/Glu-tRNA(Gln) amidotransferase subunit GatC [Armatimonadota bacterium]
MILSREQVEQVAFLARLELTGEEKDKLTGHLNQILEHFHKLQELDTDDVEPTSHVIPVENVFREDKARPSLPVEEALANAPEQQDNCFAVPRIVET